METKIVLAAGLVAAYGLTHVVADADEKANLVAKLRAARERKIAAGGRGSGRFAYAQKVPEVVALVRELHGQRQSLREISRTLAAQGRSASRTPSRAAFQA